ncbi:MAG TPA: hypothetical protein VNY84_08700, partial [Acidimicrobiales bacterium]|nr:hypothetical protein [Acidimicrobiales bacterium]
MALFGRKKDKDSEVQAPEEDPRITAAKEMQKLARTNPDALRAAVMEQAAARSGGMSVGEQIAQAQALQGQQASGADMSQLLDLAKQHAGAGSKVDASGSWIDAVLHPQSDFMRQCTCEACGGPKKLPSPSAYMYCDYCAALADFDFRALVRASGEIVDRAAYAATMNHIGAQSRDAKAAGDRDAYAALRGQFYDAWLTATPSAASHRIGDPTYRAAFIEYMAGRAVAVDFDPTYQGFEERTKQ